MIDNDNELALCTGVCVLVCEFGSVNLECVWY